MALPDFESLQAVSDLPDFESLQPLEQPKSAFPTQEQPPRDALERAARDWQLGPWARVPRGTMGSSDASKSLLGISPEMVPSGAGTRAPWLTIPLSVAGKTAAGIGGYLTSPQGATEMALAATPAAPVIFAKWAFDMARGGYRSIKGIVDEIGQMANEALNKGIISANQLGPVPEGKTTQEHIQSLAENAANAAVMGLGALGAAAHVKLPTKEVPVVPEAIPAPQEAIPEVKPEVSQEAAPTEEAGVPQPSAGPVGATVETPVTAGVTPQAIPESGTVEAPASSVTTKVTDKPKAEMSPREVLAAATGDQDPMSVVKQHYADIMKAFREKKPINMEAARSYEPDVEGVKDLGQWLFERGYRANQATGNWIYFGEAEKRAAAEQFPISKPIGMGGAEASEIPVTGAGGEKYGVAQRVREERAKAGQVAPVEPGKGMSTQQTIAMGRDIVRRDPEAGPRILEAFENDPKKATSTEGRAVVRAHGEALAAGARTIEENYGTESPEYRAAQAYLSDWDRRSKKMDTEFQRQGMAMQGETDIDTGSFTGLNRARQQAAGKDITPAQKPKAEKIAADNKQAQNDLRVSSDTLNKAIRKKATGNAEQDALDAASKTVREAAARFAQEETKSRVAKTVEEQEVSAIQVKAAQKALAAAREVERKVRERAMKEAQRRANDPSIAVWEKAKEYLDENKGLYSFDDLRNKIAADLGISPSKVTSLMARDSTIKRLAVDMWNKQRNARRLKEQAKIWLRELDTPGYEKALAMIPRSMFALSVFGHGFVALGTHAPIVAFQPRFWNAYVRNFGKMYRMVFSPSYYEAQMQDLVRRPNYEVARQAGLQNDPFKYEEFHTTAIKDLVKNWIGEKNMDRVDKLTSGGNRGYAVLKLLRQDMFDQAYDRLPRSIKVQNGVAEALADGINHATGVTKKAAPFGSNIALFAPRLAGSRVMWLGGDPIRAARAVADWKNASTAEKQFAINQLKEKAWVFGTFASLLAINQGVLSATGSKQKINGVPEFLGGAGFDPLAGDFMKFKAAGGNIAYGGALLTLTKLPIRVAFAILYEGKGSKYVLEDERVSKVVGSYVRSQMSPFAGTISDLALGRDYEERPLPAKMFGTVEQTGNVPKRLVAQGVDEPFSWAEFAATKLPIPVAEGIKEGLKGSGMPDDQANYWLKAWAITSLMTGTGTRITEDTREE